MLLPPPCPSAPQRYCHSYLLPLLLLLLQAPDLLQELRPLLPQPHDLLVGVPVFLRASGSRASGHDGAGPFPVTISPPFCPQRGPAPAHPHPPPGLRPPGVGGSSPGATSGLCRVLLVTRGGRKGSSRARGLPRGHHGPPRTLLRGVLGPRRAGGPCTAPREGKTRGVPLHGHQLRCPVPAVLAVSTELSPAQRDPVSYRAGGAWGRQGGLPLPRGAALLSAHRLAWRRRLRRNRGGGDVTPMVASLLSDPLPCRRAPGPLGTPARS